MGRMLRLIPILLAFLVSAAFGQANGKLQIHFINVGQGDGALLISPTGETVLFDDGALNNCDKPVSYLQQLGIQHIDYHIASHYHADHIGCAKEVLDEFPLQKVAYDRGGTYDSPTFRAYKAEVGTKRKTATNSTVLDLDVGAPQRVKIKIVALNGNGVSSQNENDLSVVAVVTYGEFSAVIGGDLSGYSTTTYKDIETSVGPKVGPVDVYKVNHHGSEHSTNENWLQAITPTIAVISTGEGNSYGHPTADCLERLHTAGIRTYWTTVGKGAPPDPAFDIVGGNIVVEVAPGATTFTVATSTGRLDTYSAIPGQGVVATAAATFVWSSRSSVYHYAECSYTDNISAQNRESGSQPPAGKHLHVGCPR